MQFHRIGVLALVVSCWATAPAQAVLSGYTGKAAFDAAIAALGTAQTVDFESSPAGTTFASGTALGGLTFSYLIARNSTLQVSDTFGTTSGTHYLGLDNPDTAFYLGDGFTITFDHAVHAIGLYVIAGGDAQAGDLELSVGGTALLNSASADVLVSDGQAFYLGLVESDPGAGFSSATLRGIETPGAFLAFTVDDITSAASAVPEPQGGALLLTGLLALAWLRRRCAG